MNNFLTRDQVRSLDRRAADEFGLLGLVLMENAGRSCVQSLLRHGCRGPVVICCGKGNNGGDGFVIARQLDAIGIPVKILLVADPAQLQGDAAANFSIAQKSCLPIELIPSIISADEFDQQLDGAEWLVDCLLGTGSRGNPHPPMALVIERLNISPARKFAVDLPSGLDCDSGAPGEPTVRADVTCTFVAPKIGFANPVAAEFLGIVEVGDIGVPRKLLEEYGVVKRTSSF
ncbi:NAD(P)H-hydrate epimerase [Anatilimnocola floriformis]|uniref:NAD(P)H-hydrate epimerase n=1 Tax=Anatilimnocola floriformis TaxID=2948575 RepID=UPI0020C35C03|nr:NAD(P)H-hydrate epimerase [Anatilimnocola floriformis]